MTTTPSRPGSGGRESPSVEVRRFSADGPATLTFVSDLHALSRRSMWTRDATRAELEQAIASAIEPSQWIIWGGDLFDFRWTLHSETDSIRRSIDWLDHWRQRFPDRRFVYLRGNHDVHRSFTDALSRWADSVDPAVAICDAVRIGDVLAVHGDVIERGGTTKGFAAYRDAWAAKPPTRAWRTHVYSGVVAMRLHTATAAIVHPRRRICDRLHRWIERSMPDAESVRRVVFGHTHMRIDGYAHRGRQYHNPGAAIRHVPFRPVVLDV